MSAYADTSFLVSLFVRDANSAAAFVAAAMVPPFLVHPLHRTEFANAVALCVFRRMINPAEATAVQTNSSANF